MSAEKILPDFRTVRYGLLNKCRWDHFLSMGIPLTGITVFEPGAGIGDQTEWLLRQNVKHVYVNDGRVGNIEIIKNRFAGDSRLTFLLGDLETCLPSFNLSVDLIYFYGVYYHLNESTTDFPIMRGLARLGRTIVLDYHEGNDANTSYSYNSVSASMSMRGLLISEKTLKKALKEIWRYAYFPKVQLQWNDQLNPNEVRRVAVASHVPLNNQNLVLQ
jgi:hypothetical protein